MEAEGYIVVKLLSKGKWSRGFLYFSGRESRLRIRAEGGLTDKTIWPSWHNLLDASQ